MPKKSLKVEIVNLCKTFDITKSSITKTVLRICRDEMVRNTKTINIIFCPTRIISRLNKRWRKKKSATDVLSFCYNEPDILGEIYICLPLAKVQAKRYGLSYEEEVQRLVVHGMFHLLGYDHKTTYQKAAMEKKESRYCKLEKLKKSNPKYFTQQHTL